MRSLTIISHTEHYKTADGKIVGLGSTVTEINHLLDIFDTITHVAMLHDVNAPPSALPYVSDKIHFIALPVVGGKSIGNKMAILTKAPKILTIIRKALKNSDYFQFRAPTGIGVFVIPYLIIMHSSQKGWFKYAGNWKQEHAPMAYNFQKWLLKQQSRPVTINGFWRDQPKQCLSFENPCLTDEEIQTGQSISTTKTLQFPIELCFVGRLEDEKGVQLIIDTLKSLEKDLLLKIGTVHLVGSGPRLEVYKKQVEANNLPIVFHGYLSRKEVHQIYAKSHAVLLPSASEGFPKVISEAMNYGCIPIVSKVSSIDHYIKNNDNGILMETLDTNGLNKALLRFLKLSDKEYYNLKEKNAVELKKFSYKYYNTRIKTELL